MIICQKCIINVNKRASLHAVLPCPTTACNSRAPINHRVRLPPLGIAHEGLRRTRPHAAERPRRAYENQSPKQSSPRKWPSAHPSANHHPILKCRNTGLKNAPSKAPSGGPPRPAARPVHCVRQSLRQPEGEGERGPPPSPSLPPIRRARFKRTCCPPGAAGWCSRSGGRPGTWPRSPSSAEGGGGNKGGGGSSGSVEGSRQAAAL